MRAPRTAGHDVQGRPGFTLIETGLALIVIGVGVLALVQAQQAFLKKNAWSTNASTATFLANEIREMTQHMPRHDPFSGGIYFQDPVARTGFTGWGAEPSETAVLDFDDLDDFDGVAFGDAPNLPGPLSLRLPGPVDASGRVIPDVDWQGQTRLDADGQPLPLAGWTQYVRVEKVLPGDYTAVVPNDYEQPAPFIAVDQFPLRVTVHVLYQGPFDTEATEIARAVWIVPR